MLDIQIESVNVDDIGNSDIVIATIQRTDTTSSLPRSSQRSVGTPEEISELNTSSNTR